MVQQSITVQDFTFKTDSFFNFYPRDAMLARVLAMTLCPSVSVTSRCSIEMDGQIELVFGV